MPRAGKGTGSGVHDGQRIHLLLPSYHRPPSLAHTLPCILLLNGPQTAPSATSPARLDHPGVFWGMHRASSHFGQWLHSAR